MRTWRWGVLFAGTCFFIPCIAQAEDSLFDRLDKNKDGQLSADEIESNDKGLFERLLRNHDKNSDGKLSREEFAAGTTAQPKEAGAPAPSGPGREGAAEFLKANPADIFKRLDKNGDGKITKEEAGERIRDHFDEIDTNKDGNIDSAEFTKSHEELAKRFAAGGSPPGGRPGPEMAEQLFKRLDKNSDGKITKEEMTGDGKERLERLLQRVGGDSITKEQFVKALSEMRGREGKDGKKPEAGSTTSGTPAGNPLESLKGLLQKADKNGDGKLSKEEVPPFMAEHFGQIDTNGDGQLDESELKQAAEKLKERLGGALEKLRAGKPEERK